MMKQLKNTLIVVGLLGLLLSGCAVQGQAQGTIEASGTISADLVSISPQLNEKVLTVNVREGQMVSEGEALFTQDAAMLQGQYEQASAQAAAANATLDAALAQLASARLQVDLALQEIRSQDIQARATSWQTEMVDGMVLPPWYFQKSEDLTTAMDEETAAQADLEKELANLEKVLANASNDDFVAAEQRLATASKNYLAWSAILEQAQAAQENEVMVEAAQEQLDSAKTELDAAQLSYDRMLTSSAADDVREARARVAVAQARLDMARIDRMRLQTGDDSLQLQAAQAQVEQAETAVTQAEANLAQAEAALRLIELQMTRAEVQAPVGGTILSLNIEPGEFAAAGSIVLTIGKLDEVRLVVYIPEDQYGLIKLNQPVTVSVDSYPGKTFSGQVSAIADQAEFTPRNVSTTEGRKSTVYAVEISLPNPDQALKPGMPADVSFQN